MSDQSTASRGDTEGEESVDETLDQLADTVEDAVADENAADESDANGQAASANEGDTSGDEADNSGADGSDSADTQADADAKADTDSKVVDDTDLDPDVLITRAVEDIESLLSGGSEEGSIQRARADIEDLIEVGEEAVELLESVDPAALAGAIDPEELPDAIDIEDVPEAVAETDPGEAITYRKLLQVVELREVWSGMDVRDLWENKRELADEVADVTNGGSEDGGPLAMFRDALAVLTGDDEGDLFEEDSEEDAKSDTNGVASGDDHEDIDVPSEVMQQRVQSGLDDAVEEFREGLLDVRAELEAKKEENASRVEDIEQPASRNPTAYSTLSTAGRSTREVAKHSTVPDETKYSNAPNRERLYGSRLEAATEDRDE